ncbi:MAG: UvrB/UvrC motif-containing protein [Verrucomicrobiota bacterium]
MNLDLNNLLEDWPHEPGQIRVRKIVGNDGSEKLQLRIDLGLIQMETLGRPDGQRPHGCESLLQWHMERAEDAEARGKKFVLTPEDCGELQQEGIQYYHRYISFFQLCDYPAVIRDTQRNLDLFNFVTKHSDHEEIAWSFAQFYAYVTMMNTRAKASIELDRHDFAAAIRQIERGRDRILETLQERSDSNASCPEVEFLEEWLEELRNRRPLSKLEIMQREMDHAIATEAYEEAALLRDAIKAFQATPGTE